MMRKLQLLRWVVLLLCVNTMDTVFADDVKTQEAVQQIDWANYNKTLEEIVSDPSNPKKIYLYETKNNKFVTVGGRYGAQPTLAEVGMNFFLEKVTESTTSDATETSTTLTPRYYIHSWVDNPITSAGANANDVKENGDYLGAKPKLADDERHYYTIGDETKKAILIYCDRGITNFNVGHTEEDDPEKAEDAERVKWYVEAVTEEGYPHGYRIYSEWNDGIGYTDDVTRKYYLCYYEGASTETPQKKFLAATTDDTRASIFYFIQNDDYLDAINGQDVKYINVSGLIQNARFERNNKGVSGTEYGDYGSDNTKNNVWQFRWNRDEDSYIFPTKETDLEDLAYMTAWVGPKGNFEGSLEEGNYVIQKITGLKPGLYRVNCQGFYYNPNNKEDKDNTSFIFASQSIDDVSNQTVLKTITGEDWENMASYTYSAATEESKNNDTNGYTDQGAMLSLNAGKIFAENNPYEDKDVDSRKYDNSVAVIVAKDEGSDTGTLYLGAGKRNNEGGYALFDNFQLFYMGDKQWYLDASNTSKDEFNITQNTDDEFYMPSGINHNLEGEDHYVYPVTYNLRRHFNVGKWESLILPCNLTGDQVKQAFGGDKDVKLNVFEKVSSSCVYFKHVDTDVEGIQAGKFYLIKVGKEADIKTKNDTYTFPWGVNTTVQVKGPIYQVKGVTPPTFTDNDVTGAELTMSGYTVQFKGFYYDPGAAPAGSYVVTNGDMYHLSSDWNSFVGTSWYITITDSQGNPAKGFSFSMGDDSEVTAIEGVTNDEPTTETTDAFVYNLSGQRVGTRQNMTHLPSGIYVVAGKKYIVR